MFGPLAIRKPGRRVARQIVLERILLSVEAVAELERFAASRQRRGAAAARRRSDRAAACRSSTSEPTMKRCSPPLGHGAARIVVAGAVGFGLDTAGVEGRPAFGGQDRRRRDAERKREGNQQPWRVGADGFVPNTALLQAGADFHRIEYYSTIGRRRKHRQRRTLRIIPAVFHQFARQMTEGLPQTRPRLAKFG